MQFFGGYQRKAFTQIKAHLIPKTAVRAGAGTVFLEGAVFAYMAHQIEILLHTFCSPDFGLR